AAEAVAAFARCYGEGTQERVRRIKLQTHHAVQPVATPAADEVLEVRVAEIRRRQLRLREQRLHRACRRSREIITTPAPNCHSGMASRVSKRRLSQITTRSS